MERPSVAFSAPGKVLFAGGYLVLDRDFTGLVFGLDARIHVCIETLSTSPGVTLSETIVKSPQFRDAEWRYGYRETEKHGGIEVTQLKGYVGRPTVYSTAHIVDEIPMHSKCLTKEHTGSFPTALMTRVAGRHSTAQQSRNKFVETALAYALTYASAIGHSKIGPASITILADSGYYSDSGSSGGDMPSTTERFVDFNVPLHEAHKTGLGSSAALVTAFTAAVIAHYLPQELLDVTSKSGRSRLHNLAQAAHCAAQGKVGSGFDVAAAAYGSCVYRRFSPSILQEIGAVGSEGFADRLKSVIEDSDPSRKWDIDIDKGSAVLPQGLTLLMCDVDCGSETVGMVKNVLAWRREQPMKAKLLWAALQKGNEDLVNELQTLRVESQHAPTRLDNIGNIILTIRSMIREMSEEAGVPIEPGVQTDLIDACCKLSGVIGGMVPGAGGFDAIALLVEDHTAVIQSLHGLLANYSMEVDGRQGLTIGKARLLGVRPDDKGLEMEDVGLYRDWSPKLA